MAYSLSYYWILFDFFREFLVFIAFQWHLNYCILRIMPLITEVLQQFNPGLAIGKQTPPQRLTQEIIKQLLLFSHKTGK
jgi:hypothetical protein